mmetsp:Transcript_17787/g.12740  ORF Transcript_17787/g.12740 Transcript_17787/m.12740 type:complete len:81 (+) Transcript_17787:196-438(+)
MESYFKPYFQPHFEELTGISPISMDTLNMMCKYVYWSIVDGKKLYFEVSEDDFHYCQALVDVEGYLIGYGTEKVTYLSAF